MKTSWQISYFVGRHDGEKIFLSAPTWDCGWYWGMGYLGNSKLHYHLDSLMKHNLIPKKLDEHFGGTFIIKDSKKVWLFCELFSTAYALKHAAEVLGRGGSHVTANPLAEQIKNAEEVKRINEVVLPALFDQIAVLLQEANNVQSH